MGDSEAGQHASKKRVAGRQISKENPEVDDDGPESEMGTFRRATDEVLASRRIVKVRRSQPQPQPQPQPAISNNPFAALRMVPPSNSNPNFTDPPSQTDTSGDKAEVKTAADDKPEVKDEVDAKEENVGEDKGTESGALVGEPIGTDKRDEKVIEKNGLSTIKDDSKVEGDSVQGAAGLVEAEKDVVGRGEGTREEVREQVGKENKEETEKVPNVEDTERQCAREEQLEKNPQEDDNKDSESAKPVPPFSSFQQLSSSQNAFTGLAGSGFGNSSFSFGSISKEGSGFGSGTAFSFGGSSNGSFSLQQSSTSAPDATKTGLPTMQEVPIETGEENEKAVFSADAILYEYLDGGWKERGKGEAKLNVSLCATKARLVMRARGNYRLILNASLFPDMTLANMDKKGITFACVNSAGEGKTGLSTFALKFKDSTFVEDFRGAVEAHKGKKTAALKTPENSPKAYDD